MEQNSEKMKMADPNSQGKIQSTNEKKKTVEDAPAPGEEAAP